MKTVKWALDLGTMDLFLQAHIHGKMDVSSENVINELTK